MADSSWPEKEILVPILARICSKAEYVHIGTVLWNMWVHLEEYPKFVVLCTWYAWGTFNTNTNIFTLNRPR